MAGLTDLKTILTELEPELQLGQFVFAGLRAGGQADLGALAPVGIFREPEGATFIVRREIAEKYGLVYDQPMRWIVLRVHSSLAAVGLTAAVSSKLAEAGIAANMIAGRLHDHVFVPAADGERALELLKALQRESAGGKL